MRPYEDRPSRVKKSVTFRSGKYGWDNAVTEFGEFGPAWDVLVLNQYVEQFDNIDPREVIVKVEVRARMIGKPSSLLPRP